MKSRTIYSRRWLLVFVLFTVLISCKKNTSKLNVINGIIDSDDKYPAILKIDMKQGSLEGNGEYSSCSASVISHNTLLTASHCISDIQSLFGGTVHVILPSSKKVRARRLYKHPNYIKISKEEVIVDEATDEDKKNLAKRSQYDIAILVFDDNTFEGIKPLKISNKKISEGDKILHVGYACETIISDEGKKESGTLFISSKNKYLKSKCEDEKGIEAKSIKRYGSATIKNNTLCIKGSIELRTSIDNASLDPKDRKDSEGTNSVGWFGDSGSPILSYQNPNLILALPTYLFDSKIQDEEIGVCGTVFNEDNINWLKQINDETNAIIPMDEIK